MARCVRFSVSLLTLAVLSLLYSFQAWAQTSNGTIVGKVTDKSDAAVPSATVTVTSVERGDVHNTTTDAAGGYRIESLLPGAYTVVVNASGFTEVKISGVRVLASLDTTVNANLEIAKQATTVLVEANAAQQLDTQTAELSGNFGSTEIQNLPIASLNPIELVVTEPGVAMPTVGAFSNGFNFSVNGERPRANNFLIDGQDNNDNSIGGQAFQATNLEAIGEVSILQNSYSAEFGRGGGSVTNVVTKSGTNDWHGSAFEIARNSALQTIDAADKLAGVTKNPVDIENVFGFSFSGPIVKNKAFFFVSPQWDRERSTANGSTLVLPTANGIATLQAVQPTLSANGQANVQFLLDSWAGLVATAPFADGTFHSIALGNGRPSVETGQVQRSGVAEVANDRQIYAKGDINITSKDTLSLHYIRDDSVFTPDFFNFPGSLLPYDSDQSGNTNIGGLSYSHTFSPRLVNEFRASYTEIDFVFGPTGATASNPLSLLPAVSIAGSQFTGLGFPTGLPQGRAHKNYQFQELLSATFGKHTLRGGVDLALLKVKDSIPFNSRGTLSYNAGGGFTGLGNFIDDFSGISGAAQIVFGNPVLQPNIYNVAPYVEDTWHIRSNLTAVLGLRYEYFKSPENVLPFPALDASLGIGVPGATFPGSFGLQHQEDKNNWAPRVGLAYTPHIMPWLFGNDKTVLRAGAGMYYDVLFTNILDNTGAAQPNAQGGLVQGTAAQNGGRGVADLASQIGGLTPILNPLGGITTIDSNLKNPQSYQWNANIERQLPGNLLFSAAYVGTRGVGLFINQELNPRVDFGARLNPAIGPITDRTNGGGSIYHSGQFKLERRFSKALTMRVAYTYSKLISNADEVFTVTGASTTSFSQDPFNIGLDRGPSVYDHTHVATVSYLWQLPYVHKTDGAWKPVNWVTRDWQFGGILVFETGSPATVTTGLDTNGDGRGTNDRPDLGNPSAPFNSVAIDGANPNFGASTTPGTFFNLFCDDITIPCTPVDPSQFHWIIPASGLGNVGRNTIYTPGFQNWNLSIQRSIKITERHALQFRGEFYNAFNHPNLGQPDLLLLDSDFGDTQSTRNGHRTIKIWLRYSF